MRVTMVKKRLVSGEPCAKCVQAEDLLVRRGVRDRVDDVVWADERDESSPGMVLAKKHGVSLAPFFVVEDGAETRVHTSVLAFLKRELAPDEADEAPVTVRVDTSAIDRAIVELAGAEPERVVRWALEQFGSSLALAFSGAEDVALIDMAARVGLPFRVFCLDTGRLHPETYRFLDRVRTRYGVSLEVFAPEAVAVQELVRKKGLFSFYDDGHGECCGVRKVEPLGRALRDARAWMTGQRRDQSPSTRSSVGTIEIDRAHTGPAGALVKVNPLASWSLQQVWAYLRESGAPTNELHERGFVSIGCEPCTRAVRPGEHERAGRWWWEESTKRECGLHVVT